MVYDVIIIGGGITGCAIARELSRYALHTCLLEKEAEVGFGVSKANSGIIHGGHHSNPNTLKGKLEWAGNQLWDDLQEDLGFGFKRIGEITVAQTPDQLSTLEKLQEYGQEKGVPGLEMWDKDKLQQEEQHLSEELIAGLYAPTTGVINPYEACFNLIESATINGLKFVTDCPVTALEQKEDLWEIKTPKGTFLTHYVLNAAGLFADEIAKMAGVGNFTIHPRKGEEYLLDKRLQGYIKRVIFPCPTKVSKGILIIPTFDGTLMVGPTAEMIDDKEDLTTSAAGSAQVFNNVTMTAPGISARDCIAEFAGLRPVADGEDFIIGPSAKKGFINVAGIQSPGLTAAPAIATLIVDILKEEGLALNLKDDFNPKIEKPIHFASLSTEEQMDLVKRDRTYSHLICRCEFVTQAEIADAIDRGARTLDGIKFRTRAGMGRCQGGFCSGRCMEMLAQKQNIPLSQVTKKGGDSWIVRERLEMSNK